MEHTNFETLGLINAFAAEHFPDNLFQLSNNQLIGTMSKKTDTGDMYEVLVKNYSQQEGEQYLLKKGSFFEKHLLKK